MLYVGTIGTIVLCVPMIQKDNMCNNISAFLYPSIMILFYPTIHFSSCTVSCDGRQCSLRPYSNYSDSASTHFSLRYCIAVNICFSLIIFKKMLQMITSPRRTTSYRTDRLHCSSKLRV